ncbi:MAG: glycoside hydrolase family 57 protein [Candidatus Eiseniibacteriota bacterium]
MPEPIRLALVWHMHQPSYRDAETGSVLLPWARLHATKDYRDMADTLARHPKVHATFNVTPVLWEQLDAIAAGASDSYLDAARIPAEALTERDRRFLLDRFFDVHHERMLMPHARYRELFERAGRDFTAQDWRDLQVWFHLAWADPAHRAREPLRGLVEKGRDFTEEEKASLLRWGAGCAGSVAPAYRALEAAGQIEVSTSAYHHPILPLLIDTDAPRERSAEIRLPEPPFRHPEDAREQVGRAWRAHARTMGSPPRGTWPPEGSVSPAALATLAAAGFRWVAADESVLRAALSMGEGEPEGWRRALYRAYEVETDAGRISMVFRDRDLSDRIGFTYARWDSRAAAEDFVARIHDARAGWREGESPVVTVILDGENCWESYEEDGQPFLEELYRRLEADPGIEAVTVSEALDRVPPVSRLTRIPVGSWIRDDLAIWVGHPEKNRAWDELRLAREAVDAALSAGKPGAAEALEEIYAAEASDWFWWYGDDHPTAHRDIFDRLFRAHLLRAYQCLGASAPASLRQSLRGGSEHAGDEAVEGSAGALSSRPVVDGRETDVAEWRGALVYEPAGGSGSMHQASSVLRTIRCGVMGADLFVCVDWDRESGRAHGCVVVIEIDGASVRRARVPLVAKSAGIAWDRAGDAADPGEVAIEDVVEVRLPLDLGGGGIGSGVRVRLVLEREGRPEEVAPHSGWFELPFPG